MKSPLRKLKKFGLHKSQMEDTLIPFVSSHMDGLNQAAKDLEDMKACYDALVSAAAATVNSAYEFSESLQDMGNSLLEKTLIHDDGETGEALLFLGREQLELQKLFDCYRSQIISTVTHPSESFLTELRKVEEMKLQCDEKRELFDHIVGQLKEKGVARHGKLDTLTSDQLKAVREEYEETARLCIFRVESLKKGQCRSLLTLAAHHHAAQLNFFRKGLHSLETVDIHIRSVAEKHRIDYQQSDSSYEEFDDGRYTIDAQNTSKEADSEKSRVSVGKSLGEPVPSQLHKAVSHSAPLTSENFDPAERLRETRPSVQKFNTHVLPTPDDAKSSSTSSTSLSSGMLVRGGSSKNLWHSSPQDKQKKSVNEALSSHSIPKSHLSTEENINNKHQLPLPPRLTETFDSNSIYDVHKITRQAFSGPLAGKSLANKALVAVSEIYGRASGTQPVFSSSVSQSAPPSKVSELHELPRPPDSFNTTAVRCVGAQRHSAPLVSPTSRNVLSSNEGLPHLTVSRSFSIPSSSTRSIFQSGKLFQSSSQVGKMTEVVEASVISSLTPSRVKSFNSRQI